MADQPTPRKHLAERWSSAAGLNLRCTCGQWESGHDSTTREKEDAHRAHRVAMGETVKPRQPSGLERLQAEIEALRVRLWLIAQTLQQFTTSDDPAGIVGDVGPLLDGPIHPDQTAAYRAAKEA